MVAGLPTTFDINRFTDDFVEEWNGNNLNVNGANINFDGRYGTQCMDLWNYWWTELGIPVAGFPRHVDAAAVWEDTEGAHYDYFDGILPSSPAQKGDVFIYNRQAWGTGFGHIGIVLSDNGDSITVLEANGLGDGYEDQWMNQYGSPPRIHTWPKTNLYGYLRYINQEEEVAKLDKEDLEAIQGLTNSVKDAFWGSLEVTNKLLVGISQAVNKLSPGTIDLEEIAQAVANEQAKRLKD